MEIKNYTPHPINIIGGGVTKNYPSLGVIRSELQLKKVGIVNGIPLTKSSYSGIENMPENNNASCIIVSKIAAEAILEQELKLPKGSLLTIPSQLVRDENGKILGCESLELIKEY